MTGTILALLVGLLPILQRVAGYFSDTSKLHRLVLALERHKAAQEVEAERLKATYERIEREPPLTGRALIDRLNEVAKRLRESKK